LARIEIPERFRDRLGMPYYEKRWVDVKLKDGRWLKNLVAREFFVTGRESDPDCVGPLDFDEADIADVRRHTFFLHWFRCSLFR